MENLVIDTKCKVQKKWEKHIKAWQVSNLTIAEYARQEKLAYSSFHKWKSKLLKEESTVSQKAFAKISLPLATEKQEKIFVPQKTKTLNIILQVKDYNLEIPNNFDKKTLLNLLDCLNEREQKSCV